MTQAPCSQVPGTLWSFQSESEDSGYLKYPVTKLFSKGFLQPELFAQRDRMLEKLETQLLYSGKTQNR